MEPRVKGVEHWTNKGDVRLFLWEKKSTAGPAKDTIL